MAEILERGLIYGKACGEKCETAGEQEEEEEEEEEEEKKANLERKSGRRPCGAKFRWQNPRVLLPQCRVSLCKSACV